MRFNVVGTSGSGKSTFARHLAAALKIPHVEMDLLFWQPNWTETPDKEFLEKLSRALAGKAWVLDGNYDRSREVKWKNVETVVWLDYSFGRILGRSLKRSLVRAVTRKEIWPGTGNRESFARTFFSKDSVVLWMLTSFSRVRARYVEDMNDPANSHIRFVRLRSPREARQFLATI